MPLRPLALLLLALPAACGLATARALRDPGVRVQLSQRVYATLQSQDHYFPEPDDGPAFATRLQRIAATASDASSYYRGVSDALALLGEGHTGLVASAEVPFSNTVPPVAILEVKGLAVVAGVAPGVEGGGLRAGDVILEVDERPAQAVLDEGLAVTAGSTPHARRARAIANLLAGPTNTPARVRVRGLDGRERDCFPLRFLLDDGGEDRFRFGFLPTRVKAVRVTSSVGYIALPDFHPERYDALVESLYPLGALPTLILDLRGNPGGRIRTLQHVAGVFTSGPVELLQVRDGTHAEAVRAIPGATRYRGELKILVDERTGSAAELLAAALQDLGRATVYGRRTAGSTRSRRSSLLPGGVVFHYAGKVEFRRRDGRAVEGVGVTPDVFVQPSRESLARGLYGSPEGDPTVRLAIGLN